MKKRTVFEPSDFQGSGQMIVRESASVGTGDISFLASVAYKIGWALGSEKNKALKISLTDGMVSEFESTQALCEALNRDTFGFRPMTPEEINAVTAHVGNRF